MKKRGVWILTALLLGSGAAAYVYQQQQAQQNPEQKYKWASLDKGDVTQTVSANGTLNPVVLVSVGTQVSGTVKKLHVDFNDKVRAGQALLELDDALLAAQARQSEANLANASAALELARSNEARIKQLFADEYVSRQEYDQAQQGLRSASAQHALARAQLEKDRVNLGNTTIRSPVSGVVVDRIVDLGQTVAASFQTPVLIKIAQDLKEMRIDTSFAEADIGAIREGQKARFTVDAFPNRHFIGEVQQIRLNPTNQQNVVTYNVRVTVPNEDQLLLPGMTAYVNIGVVTRRDVLRVPNAALRFRPQENAEKAAGKPPEKGMEKAAKSPSTVEGGERKKRDGQSATVYVQAEEGIKPVSLQIGITDNRFTEVLGGELKPGDQVVMGDNAGQKKAPSSVGMRMF